MTSRAYNVVGNLDPQSSKCIGVVCKERILHVRLPTLYAMSLEDGAGLRFCKGAISVSLARGSGSCSGSAQRASPSAPPLRSHLSVKFKQWDGLGFRASPLSRLPSNITWGPNWALRDAPAGDNTASPLPPFDLRL